VPATVSTCLNEETGTMTRTGSDAAINPLDPKGILNPGKLFHNE